MALIVHLLSNHIYILTSITLYRKYNIRTHNIQRNNTTYVEIVQNFFETTPFPNNRRD